MQFLFITGTSRAGTSIMADCMRSHRMIAMGRERYAYRYKNSGEFTPELFEKKRFCLDFFIEDSHHSQMNPYYKILYSYYENCIYVGDKLPYMSQDYTPIISHFKNHKILYMARNIHDVASSFEVRAHFAQENPNKTKWPGERNHAVAVDEWNKSIANTLKNLKKLKIFIVEYSRLFKDLNQFKEIFSFLNLPITPTVYNFYKKASAMRSDLDKNRTPYLTPQQVEYINDNARFDLFQTLLSVQKKQP